MDLISSNLIPYRATLYTSFMRVFKDTVPWHPMIAVITTSKGRSNIYRVDAQTPGLKEWIGPRTFAALAARGITLENKPYEGGVRSRVDDIADDEIGAYPMQAEAFGAGCRKYQDGLLVALMRSGHTSVCYDGQYFYDTDHPVDLDDASKGVWQNYWASGMALTAANFETVYATMCSRIGEEGRALDLKPTLLQVPPQLRSAAVSIVGSKSLANGADNPNFGIVDIMVVNELSVDPTTWYLHGTDGPMKPFIVQNREGVTIKFTDVENGHVALYEGYFDMLGNARGAVGYGLPHFSSKAAA